MREAFRDIRLRLARLNAYLQEQLSGMRIVQLFGREKSSASRFAELNRDHLDAHLRSITIYAVFFPVVEMLTAVAMALLLWYGGLRVIGGTLTIGILAAFIQYTRRFFQPLQDLSEKFNLLQSAMASSERVFSLLDETVAVREPAVPTPLPRPVRGAVRFENVWFRYSPDGPWVLRDISFTASPGRTIALVGHTGAGKTTIVNLLLRFYDPDRGQDHGGWRGYPRAVDGRPPRRSSASCSRTSSSLRETSCTISRSMLRWRRKRRGKRRGGWAPTGSSSGCPPATGTCSASGAEA